MLSLLTEQVNPLLRSYPLTNLKFSPDLPPERILGLSIVQEIVNKHRGQVEVFSEGVPGKGATFSLWLLAVGSADEKRQAPDEESI
jgi:hypothetical protein